MSTRSQMHQISSGSETRCRMRHCGMDDMRNRRNVMHAMEGSHCYGVGN